MSNEGDQGGRNEHFNHWGVERHCVTQANLDSCFQCFELRLFNTKTQAVKNSFKTRKTQLFIMILIP